MLSDEPPKLSEQSMVKVTTRVGTYVIGPVAKPKPAPSPAPSVRMPTSTYGVRSLSAFISTGYAPTNKVEGTEMRRPSASKRCCGEP
jgi:hypothetical protein